MCCVCVCNIYTTFCMCLFVASSIVLKVNKIMALHSRSAFLQYIHITTVCYRADQSVSTNLPAMGDAAT